MKSLKSMQSMKSVWGRHGVRRAGKVGGAAAAVSGLAFGLVRLEGYLWRRSFRNFRFEG